MREDARPAHPDGDGHVNWHMEPVLNANLTIKYRTVALYPCQNKLYYSQLPMNGLGVYISIRIYK